MCRQFDTVLTVTDVDRLALPRPWSSTGPGQNRTDPQVIPIAVDTEELPVRRRSPSANHILHIGTMFWPPNVDGIRWFVRSRSAPDPAGAARRESRCRGCESAGRDAGVEHERPRGACGRLRRRSVGLPASAGVFVVPLLAGGGMRVKILTAMAQGLPVVSTTIGCEGIDVVPGRHLLVGDTPSEFAAADPAPPRPT